MVAYWTAKISYCGLGCAATVSVSRRNSSAAIRIGLGIQHLLVQHFCEEVAIDVAASYDGGDTAAGERALFLQDGRDSRGASAFGHVVRIVIDGAHRGGDLLVGDHDDA